MKGALKKFVNKNTLAKYNYNKKFKPIGVTFEEYTDYLFEGINNPGFVESRIFNVPIKRVGTYSFIQNVEEVLVDEVYKFKAKTDKPYILDCGANIGLSVIYFKRLYPQAKIVAFEPDSAIHKVCTENVEAFGFDNVVVEQAAIWKSDGVLVFLGDNSLGGKIVDGEVADKAVKVRSVRLRSYLENKKVDFLKLDIEGAELEVLRDCADVLSNIDTLFVEYHSASDKPQYLHEILSIISEAGFRYYIKPAWDFMKHPFLDHPAAKGHTYDLQLNIFAYKG